MFDLKSKETFIAIIGVVVVLLLLTTSNLIDFGSSGLALTSSSDQTDNSSDTTSDDSAQVLLDGGIVVRDLSVGLGNEVTVGSRVSIHYIGGLQDGTIFDNSIERGAPIQFTIGAGEVIQGVEIGMIGMRVGGRRSIVIAPEYAYGETGAGPIPPNTPIIFDVEVLGVEYPNDNN